MWGADLDREDARVSIEESGEWSQAALVEGQHCFKA